ncbi:hypothetical protein [Desulfovibrio sp. An276]|uniref:hypothetical protein n=1 Tax=Desulfovibrio sp. An276 TaxID=1965618 RepID=UPI001186F291|nr:hypothetical protein [Desulfovibrio sp. An276]
MIIFITLDNNYNKIWERSGKATFSSHYEKPEIVNIIKDEVHNKKIYAIGLYRAKKSSGQLLPPSLLCITKVTILSIDNIYAHDIIIDFNFIKKMPVSLNNDLEKVLIEPTPLIRYIPDSQVVKILQSGRYRRIL